MIKKRVFLKKLMFVSLLLFLSFILSGCYYSTFNSLGKENYIRFENDDQSVRLEIATMTSDTGKLFVDNDGITYNYTIQYRLVKHWIGVYLSIPGEKDNFFSLDVSFEAINFIKTNYNRMYLKDESPEITHPVLSGFDVVLTRNKNKPLAHSIIFITPGGRLKLTRS